MWVWIRPLATLELSRGAVARRQLYGKAQATFAELKQVGSALDKCRETINKVDLKPSDLETANGMAQHPEALGAEAPLLWTSRS